ncbi:MAG: HAMP domain-containing histidine kinase, partial [Verrucomicrobia bacterium]|nr:HAMP domain-containing histidine kinase [Verrucomicrobiota bacterium]
RGMAHDLNNLLTPISTYLQLCHAGPISRETQAELLPVSLRNVETMHAYIRAALFFSQNNQPHFQLGRLDEMLHRSVHFADARLKRKNIAIRIETPGEVVVEMDEVLIQRLVGNLLSNAIDASRDGQPVRLILERQPALDAGGEWVQLRVVDEGEGISPDNLRRISYAYFTTKDSGDENRGFGLGLAICRKIVRLHGGQLNLASVEKKGTTVQVDLPCRQNKKAETIVGMSV